MIEPPKYLPLLIGADSLFIGALFIWIGSYLCRDGRELRRSGVTLNATVQEKFRKQEDRSFGGLENYYIHAMFADADGKTQITELKVQSKVWHPLKEGGSVQFTWLSGHLDSIKLGPRWGRQVRGIVGDIATVVFPIGYLASFLRNKP